MLLRLSFRQTFRGFAATLRNIFPFLRKCSKTKTLAFGLLVLKFSNACKLRFHAKISQPRHLLLLEVPPNKPSLLFPS